LKVATTAMMPNGRPKYGRIPSTRLRITQNLVRKPTWLIRQSASIAERLALGIRANSPVGRDEPNDRRHAPHRTVTQRDVNSGMIPSKRLHSSTSNVSAAASTALHAGQSIRTRG